MTARGEPPPGGGSQSTSYRPSANGDLPRHLVVTPLEGQSFERCSPFKVADAFQALVGNIKNCRKVKECLFIETITATQSMTLLSLTEFMGKPVSVSAHRTRNLCKGVIRDRELTYTTEEELVERLRSQGVVAARKMKRRLPDGSQADTGTAILTFERSSLPHNIKLGLIVVDIREYIPDPVRCWHCQRFGHTNLRCPAKEKPPTCVCGHPKHDGSPCTDKPTCPNCQNPHTAKDKSCPVYTREARIEQVRTTEKLSYVAARKKVTSQSPPSGATYSQVTQSTSTASQSGLTELIDALKPILKQMIQDVVKECFRAHMELSSVARLYPSSLHMSTESLASQTKRKPDEPVIQTSDESIEIRGDSTPKRKKKKKSPRRKVVPKLVVRLPPSNYNATSSNNDSLAADIAPQQHNISQDLFAASDGPPLVASQQTIPEEICCSPDEY